MKLKNGFVVKKMNDGYVGVTADEAGEAFSGMIRMNGSAAFIIEQLRQPSTVESISNAICDNYEITYEAAERSTRKVIASLEKIGLLDA